MTKTLKQRVINSGSWTIFGHLFSQILRLASNLILTRLLVPEMFGVMAIVTVFLMGIAMFSDIGLLQNIVQSKRGEDRVFLNTAWTIQIIRGGAVFFITLLLSSAVYFLGQNNFLADGSVYADPQLPFLLGVMSITSVITGFNSINLLSLNRRLMISKAVIIDVTSQVLGLVFMIITAWIYRDIWALVLGSIISSLIKMTLSHHHSLGERNKIVWDKSCAYEILHFAKWIFLSSILGFMLAQGDRLLLGYYVSPEVLGIYNIAFFLAMALKEALKKLVSTIFYPMLAEIAREDSSKLKNVYYKIRSKVDFLTMLFAGVMMNFGQIIIDILYDERYVNAGWMLEVLSVSIIFVGYSLAGVCLMAKGQVKSNMWLILVATSFLYISVPVAFHYYGLYGAIVMISLNYIIDLPSTFYMLKKHNLLDITKEFRMLPLLVLSYFVSQYLVSFFK